MSWGSKNRRKALRGNSKAKARLNLLEVNEKSRETTFYNKGFKSCVSRSLYESSGVMPVVSNVERLTKQIDGQHQNTICIIDLRKFKTNKRLYTIDRENFRLVKSGFDCLKAKPLSSTVLLSPSFMDRFVPNK